MTDDHKVAADATYVVTMNGRTTFELTHSPGSPKEAELETLLGRLDGRARFAILVGKLPDDMPFDRVDLEVEPAAYLQCAGGVSGRFTCEIRSIDAAGRPVHEIVGRRNSSADSGSGNETIAYSEFETSVEAHEVLAMSDARDLLLAYLATGETPASYTKRRVTSSYRVEPPPPKPE